MNLRRKIYQLKVQRAIVYTFILECEHKNKNEIESIEIIYLMCSHISNRDTALRFIVTLIIDYANNGYMNNAYTICKLVLSYVGKSTSQEKLELVKDIHLIICQILLF
jgi:hypothetical protein